MAPAPVLAGAKPLKPFMVLARLFTRSEEAVKIELGLLKGVGEYELQKDECGQYCYMLPFEGDQTIFTLLETYDTKDYMLGHHRESPAFVNLKKVEAEKDTRLKSTDVTTLIPAGGFLEREKPSDIPLADQFFWIAYLTAHQGKKDELLAAVLAHSQYVFKNEPEALSFMVSEVEGKPDEVIVFERYTGEAYFRSTHVISDSIQALRVKFQELVAERHSGGLHAVRGFVHKEEPML